MGYDENHEKEITYFARTNFRNQMTKFGIKQDDRRRHMYVIGKTGMGKTTLLENFILSDIYAGHGCCYIDPHGDTAEKLIDYIPSWRLNDVVYFNPSDVEYPIGFNVFETVSETHKHLVASGLMSVFKKIWENMWSSRMEYILNNSILALLDNPGSTLLGVNRLLSDAEYRKRIVGNVKDPIVKQFWVKEFASYNDKYAQEAVAPIQNKIGQFLSASVIRNIVAQVKSTINIRDIMDQNKIFIVNLSKGRIGEDSMRLLGGMLITKVQLSAMERVDMPESERKDFYMYVDEFQNFATESFAAILSEARKYRLCLTMAHQYIAQLTDEVREAVFGNVGSIITFRVGSPDAQFMETEFGPHFLPEDLINIPKFNIYLKLLIDGVTSHPFSAATLPPIAQQTHSFDKIMKISRERYAKPKAEIEEKVLKWSGMEDFDEEKEYKAAADKKKSMKPNRKPKHEYDCTECGDKLTLPVELDRSRPIYCDNCIEKVRERRKSGGKGGDKRRDDRKKKPDVKIGEGKVVEKLPDEPAISLSSLASREDEKPKEDKAPPPSQGGLPSKEKKRPEEKRSSGERRRQPKRPSRQSRQSDEPSPGTEAFRKQLEAIKKEVETSKGQENKPERKTESKPERKPEPRPKRKPEPEKEVKPERRPEPKEAREKKEEKKEEKREPRQDRNRRPRNSGRRDDRGNRENRENNDQKPRQDKPENKPQKQTPPTSQGGSPSSPEKKQSLSLSDLSSVPQKPQQNGGTVKPGQTIKF